ncbi:hypothetical protein KHS38_14085 [Mucilaginibacter sp. Bleaf8]|uniref:hypothetical protein n=1 Tax=Mucilaginibacter sp. Bleaf8 TaxID=2834430 RepID=UPI001BCCD485|nr:hypothetical protein [Mucilaginibacter sp. Bleaf8]MBS7565538.1 hypothetical protein [Mucilaginibacter sp. Bleaf8]
MEAVHINNNSFNPPLKKVITTFFNRNSPESVQLMFWRLFQCWVTKDCTLRGEVSDQEVALVFDQLNDLVAAAYMEHQTGSSSGDQEERPHA